MLSSSAIPNGECTCTCVCNRRNPRGSASSSSSSSSSSSTSSFSHLHQTPKSIDDIWRDINLSSFNDQNTPTTNSHSHPSLTSFTIAIDPPTSLSLTPHKDLQLAQPHHNTASKLHPFHNRSYSNKTYPQPVANSGDTRNTRMMKNRESAARSRARKQAYMFELKQKVKHLQEENARLKKQQQLMCETAANQGKKKGNLYRAATAPF